MRSPRVWAAPGRPYWPGVKPNGARPSGTRRGALLSVVALVLSGCAAGGILSGGPNAAPPLSGWFVGPGESACAQGLPPEHVALYSPPSAFDRDQLSRSQRSTARISVRPEAQLAPLLAKTLNGKPYDLGILKLYSESGQGICTGTLIDSSLIVTAGHCVSPKYWYAEHYLPTLEHFNPLPPPPRVINKAGEHVRYFTSTEIALLLQADFSYQRVYTADAGGFASNLAADSFSLPLKEVVATQYQDPKNQGAKDYAILRVDRGTRDLSSYSLGLGKLRYNGLSAGRPVAIVQHPAGGEKKVAAGTLLAVNKSRLEYNNISTDGGSSGAGIFLADGGIAGIHTRGGCGSAQTGGTNKGFELKSIKSTLDDLRSND